MTSRTIAALRRLAERPGTEHEGAVARAMLERAGGSDGEEFLFASYRSYLRRELSIDELVEAMRGSFKW